MPKNSNDTLKVSDEGTIVGALLELKTIMLERDRQQTELMAARERQQHDLELKLLQLGERMERLVRRVFYAVAASFAVSVAALFVSVWNQ